jgi:hypothetical protein
MRWLITSAFFLSFQAFGLSLLENPVLCNVGVDYLGKAVVPVAVAPPSPLPDPYLISIYFCLKPDDLPYGISRDDGKTALSSDTVERVQGYSEAALGSDFEVYNRDTERTILVTPLTAGTAQKIPPKKSAKFKLSKQETRSYNWEFVKFFVSSNRVFTTPSTPGGFFFRVEVVDDGADGGTGAGGGSATGLGTGLPSGGTTTGTGTATGLATGLPSGTTMLTPTPTPIPSYTYPK